MKKAIQFIYLLAGYITLLFIGGMLTTYVSDWLQQSGFFGDSSIKYSYYEFVDNTHLWGARHYWYYWLGVMLFILLIVRITMWAYKFWNTGNAKN